MVYELEPTVNPLVYKVELRWETPLSGQLLNGVWNLFQQWAAKNDSVPQGKTKTGPCSIAISVVIKRRFGDPKERVPWDK